MENSSIPHESRSDAADKYREELEAQLAYVDYDGEDYDNNVLILFPDYVKLLQDEWARVNSKGVCGNCVDGLMVDCTIDYRVVCRIDSKDHSRWDTCGKFRE